jgi:hypothetical protein
MSRVRKDWEMFKTRDVNLGSWHPHRNASTLRQLLENRIALLVVCRRCKHEGRLHPADHIARFGENCAAVNLRGFVRCSVCRSRSANIHEATR